MPKPAKLSLNPSERRASVCLAGLFAARMLGLFLLLPVFAVAAQSLEGGLDPVQVGLALGMYGLTQAVMQIPFGMASDRVGRRPVILFGLVLFIVGSVICALSESLFWVTIGRAVQGSGAISAAITAWLADSTRPEVRTRAMAMVGASIGLSFAVSLVLAPVLVGWGGLQGLFWVIAGLGGVAFAVAAWVVPVVPRDTHAPAQTGTALEVLGHGGLIRLNIGVFSLHLTQVALFVVVPPLLVQFGGISADHLWHAYLPVILVSFLLMVPIVFLTETRRMHVLTLKLCVMLLMIVGAGLALATSGWWSLLFWLTVFFVAFNVLEALQPSLVSRIAPPHMKGLALGVYSTTQALGLFLGGALGGWLARAGGPESVFWAVTILSTVWLVATWSLKSPPMVQKATVATEHP
ncbi:MFS transporter [Orrella marina]|uniref:MFS transporter n=1 Tax=Orrella marina TaxID=2163011 RepID=A0A2R4XLF0_9BURK|nr:MFS transporter [Orrella marina]AWB34630.1 MFS transporter [Orrella marina]